MITFFLLVIIVKTIYNVIEIEDGRGEIT